MGYLPPGGCFDEMLRVHFLAEGRVCDGLFDQLARVLGLSPVVHKLLPVAIWVHSDDPTNTTTTLLLSLFVIDSSFSRGSLIMLQLQNIQKGYLFQISETNPNFRFIATPIGELWFLRELRKIGFCDYQNVLSRNEEKVHK